MALDRKSIERKDFPTGPDGYDPDAVDAHLGRLADEVEELTHSTRLRSETLAAAASEQVRAIVEAAETSAAEIHREAAEKARQLTDEATDEAQATREQAAGQAREYVGKVSAASATTLQRLEEMEGELSALIESLRAGSGRLGADLQLLEGDLAEVRGAVSPGPPPEPEPEVTRKPPAQAQGSDDSEGARLIALNMALNGSSREEVDRYLTENFQLADRRGLLDEVYASVGG